MCRQQFDGEWWVSVKKIDLGNGSYIEAKNIQIGKNVTFGKDIKIKVRGNFSIGDNSYIGDRFVVNAESVTIGDYFFYIPTDNDGRGMVIGGGGSNFPFAHLIIGDRCVCHTGHINLARPVTIGNDVGLSHDVDILTHGFWANSLEGYPKKTKEVVIGNNVIVGWRTIIMSGVSISNDIVIGAGSIVVKDLGIPKSVYAGSPAKFIGPIVQPSLEKQNEMFLEIVNEFNELMNFYENPYTISHEYPVVKLNGLTLNLLELTCNGYHDEVTDAFRDFLRRHGIRIFHERGFPFKLIRK